MRHSIDEVYPLTRPVLYSAFDVEAGGAHQARAAFRPLAVGGGGWWIAPVLTLPGRIDHIVRSDLGAGDGALEGDRGRVRHT